MSQSIVLIADDDSALVDTLQIRCKKLGLNVFGSSGAMHAVLETHRLKPDLLIINIDMPGGNGISELLANDTSCADTSVIVMSEELDDAVVDRCRSAGSHYVQKNAQLWPRLRELIGQLMETTTPNSEAVPQAAELEQGTTLAAWPTVLCIDDDPDITYVIKRRLERYGVNVVRAFAGMEGYWKALECQPQAIICDLNMPDGEGHYINGRLKSNPLTRDTPVIILTGQANLAIKREMYSLGVSSYLHKPLDFKQLLQTLEQYIPLDRPEPAKQS